jgi:hypothetical protein
MRFITFTVLDPAHIGRQAGFMIADSVRSRRTPTLRSVAVIRAEGAGGADHPVMAGAHGE